MSGKTIVKQAVIVSGNTVTGGNGVDIIDWSNRTGNWTIVGGNGSDIVIGSQGNDTIWGDSLGNTDVRSDNGMDTLNGWFGNDTIHGGNGADKISGDDGADRLWGNRGGDIFRYHATNDSDATPLGAWNATRGDTIGDFKSSEGDKLDFTGVLPTTTSGLPSQLRWLDTWSDDPLARSYAIWHQSGVPMEGSSYTFVYADTSGDGIADMAIRLLGNVAFTPDDFSGGVGVNVGPSASADSLSVAENASASGTLADNVSDANLLNGNPLNDALTFALTGPSIAGLTLAANFANNGNYTFDANHYDLINGCYTYDYLKDGDTLVLTTSYTVSDKFGGSKSENIKITITGVNDAATFGGDLSGSVTEDHDTDSVMPGVQTVAIGTLTTADKDAGETGFKPVTEGLNGAYGTFTFSHLTGAWTYTLNNGSVDHLNNGDVEFDSLWVEALDGTKHEIKVTINGVTDSNGGDGGSTPTHDPFDFDDFAGGALWPLPSNDLNDANVIRGTSGADEIDGRANPDVIFGLAGDDLIDGGNDTDYIFGGSGDDTILGREDADYIFGGSGSDTIVGFEDGDIIVGGWGADTLTGSMGPHADVFVFLSSNDTGDTITDFQVGTDKISFGGLAASPAVFPVAWGAIPLMDLTWQGELTGDATLGAGGVGWYQSGLNTIVVADLDGNTATADFMITLEGNLALTRGDFLFV